MNLGISYRLESLGMTHSKHNAARFIPGESRIHQISLSPTEIPPAKYGGSELIVSNLSRGLADLGQNVTVYSPGSCALPGVEHFPTLESPAPLYDRDGKIQPNVPEHIEAICKGLQENLSPGDIVHFNHFQQAGKIERHLPTATQTFETSHWLYVGSEPVIYPSFAMKGKIQKPGVVVPHGIDLDLFKNTARPKREDFVFYAGRFTEDKGLSIADEACKSKGIELVLAGPKPQTDFGEKLVSENTYLGELEPYELVQKYSIAKAVAYPSIYLEPFGLTPIEAMACGCPVITTGNGGLGETSLHGKTGYFAATSEEFAVGLENISCISPEDCISRAQNYSIEKMARSVLEAYCLFYG